MNTVLSDQHPPAPLNSTIVTGTAVAGLGGLLFGFDTAVIAGTTHALTVVFRLSPASLGLTVAIALWGTILGAILAGFPGDRYGRRDGLRGLAMLFFVSAIGCALAWGWLSFVVWRFITGLAIGGSSVLGPMYIAEIAPARWRGRLVGFFQLCIVLGILVAYFSNYVVGSLHLGQGEWRWQPGVGAVPAMLFFLMLFHVPRSPRWLAGRGRLREAEDVLERMGEDSRNEIVQIINSLRTEHFAGRRFLGRVCA